MTERKFFRALTTSGVFCGALLAALSALAQETAEKKPDGPLPMTASPEVRIYHALNEPVTLEFDELPLSEAAAAIAKEAQVEVTVCRRALEENGLGVDLAVSAQLRDVKLRWALNRLLEPHALTWVLRDGAIEITTESDAADNAVTRAYAIGEIASLPDDPDVLDVDSLIEAITTGIEQESWEDVGGPGTVRSFGALLVIGNHEEAQRQIESFLAAAAQLKKKYAEAADAQVTDPLPLAINAEDDAVRQKVAAAKATFDFEATPLTDIAAALEESTKVPIEIDAAGLSAEGIGTDISVTIKATDVPLATALSRVLREIDLAWIVDQEAVLITTTSKAAAKRFVRIYPVRDLVKGDRHSSIGATAELTQLITSVASPDTWQNTGGPGSVSFVDPLEALVISQSEEVHAKVADLLAKIRAARPADAEEDDDDARGQIKVYRPLVGAFPAEMATELMTMIKALAPESWSGDGTMHSLGGAIVIRQTPEVHRQISKMFRSINMPVTTHGSFFANSYGHVPYMPAMGGPGGMDPAMGGMGGAMGGMGGGMAPPGMGAGGMAPGGMGGGFFMVAPTDQPK
jgi:hypothetical protein